MPRTPIYPKIEEFIAAKKHAKLEKIQTNNALKIHRKEKMKDTADVKRSKSKAKRRRQETASASTYAAVLTCSSCGEEGHKSARNRNCINYNLTLKEIIQIRVGENSRRYTISIPFESFCKTTAQRDNSLEKINTISAFIREVLFKAQTFVNYFILKYPENLTNDFFDQNFWYTITRAIRNSSDKAASILAKYSHIGQLSNAFVELSNHSNVSLFVSESGIKNYGQSLSAACDTLAITYNNYYVENFENVICNYFIYSLKNKFPNMTLGHIKNLVYNHVYDEVLLRSEPLPVPANILLKLFDTDATDNLFSFLIPLVLEINNRMPTLPVSKETLNSSPFSILPAFRHILLRYEELV